jgi:hypothetical protein
MVYPYSVVFVATKALSFQRFVTSSIPALLIASYAKEHLLGDYFATSALAHSNCHH